MKVFLALTTLFIWSNAQAIEVHGVMMVVKGSIKIESGKDHKLTSAKVGAQVFAKDTIIAEKESRAKIVMSDQNEINIMPETRMSLEKYVFNPQSNEKNVILNVIYGKVRSSVKQKYDGDQNKFHVKTPSAVAGVRGTDFIASYDPSTQVSKIVTFSGVVEVGQYGAGGTIQNSVKVAPGQFTTAAPNQMPTAPASVPKNDLNSLNQQSKAETAKLGADAAKPGVDKVPAPSDGKNVSTSQPSDAKNGTAAQPSDAKNGSTAAPTDRTVSSAPPPPPPTMITPKDLGPTAIINDTTPNFAGHGADVHEVPTIVKPTDVLPPKCDFCDRAISTGPTKLNIQINIQ